MQNIPEKYSINDTVNAYLPANLHKDISAASFIYKCIKYGFRKLLPLIP